MTRLRSSSTLAILVAAGCVTLTACSGSASTSPDGGQSDAPASTADESGRTTLIGTVGTADDPDAFEIALTDAGGTPVTTLPAGDYALTFADRSSMHNFHLAGPGDVNVGTDVGGTDESTVEITLVPGTYRFVCDPHLGSMSGEVEVEG